VQWAWRQVVQWGNGLQMGYGTKFHGKSELSIRDFLGRGNNFRARDEVYARKSDFNTANAVKSQNIIATVLRCIIFWNYPLHPYKGYCIFAAWKSA
jgi:hypothetical protein